VVEHHDVVGELVGLFEVLRREQQRRTFGDQLTDEIGRASCRERV